MEKTKPSDFVIADGGGDRYVRVYAKRRAECETQAFAAIPTLGEKTPLCYENLGKSLALLELVASCHFGCPGDKDGHRIHRLLGRVVSNANAALALALQAYYDESLSLARNVGEIANLLSLFQNDPAALTKWETLPGDKRWREFRPKAVRTKLLALGHPLLVTEAEYSVLSEVATHVGPTTSPQTLSTAQRPKLGTFPTVYALVTCLNELGWAVGSVCLPGALLLLKGKEAKALLELGAQLLRSVGGLRLDKVPAMYKKATEQARE
jgi:hypothetical protein